MLAWFLNTSLLFEDFKHFISLKYFIYILRLLKSYTLLLLIHQTCIKFFGEVMIPRDIWQD